MKIRENIFSVGVVDEKVRIFHGYLTPVGTTYNAFLVVDEQVTLVDFVKASFAEEFLKNIVEVLGDRDIDNIICNHVEPDHSGALPQIVKKYPKAVVYGTANCEKGLSAYYPDSQYEFKTVKLGDTLCTGDFTFSFIPMPMVHWPDSMATYLKKEKLLFSNDAFGQHYGKGEVYDHELPLHTLMERVGNYYANIVMPFGLQVQNLAKQLGDCEIEMVCPSHGVILTDYSISAVLEGYIRWATQTVDEKKAVIIYDTMWGTTRKMAHMIRDEYVENGFSVDVLSLSDTHYSEAISAMLEASHVIVGSSTLNNCMMPTVAAFLEYMRGLKPKNRIGMAFGSYGWSGESIRDVEATLVKCGFEILPARKVKWNV